MMTNNLSYMSLCDFLLQVHYHRIRKFIISAIQTSSINLQFKFYFRLPGV